MARVAMNEDLSEGHSRAGAIVRALALVGVFAVCPAVAASVDSDEAYWWVDRQLLQERNVRIHGDGSTLTVVREIWTAGMRSSTRTEPARVVYRPNGDLTKVTLQVVRINGHDQLHASPGRAQVKKTEAGELVVELRELRPGDEVDVQLQLQQRPLIPRHFFSTLVLAKPYPVVRSVYRVTLPRAQPLHYRVLGIELNPHVFVHEQERTLSWEVGFTPAWTVDAHNAGPPRVVVSSTDSWEPVQSWFSARFAQAAELPAALSDGLPPALGFDVQDPEAVVALARRLAHHIEYERPEIGMNTLIPRNPSDVWAQQRGDCKDMALFLSCVLNHRCVRARPVLLSPLDLRNELPNPFVFVHALVEVTSAAGVFLVDPQSGDMFSEADVQPHLLKLDAPRTGREEDARCNGS